ncbi:hypothetical protein H696_03833 [Fonticula alba]|uniref:Tyrosine specific protein phosphatases domain-containing protein n=1 Tax=Fonticula alba TaxID=691883 RepID=A0A058Z7A2_FONAL|nr:hypothetical protein H696_03833 [Fonticula alba]KCV69402.1 hypothetical protein H696_03833 [Fonticula alba]|eukprot:XP_009495967.1 hypothetical protein H696_03833 [Fonticula alba]
MSHYITTTPLMGASSGPAGAKPSPPSDPLGQLVSGLSTHSPFRTGSVLSRGMILKADRHFTAPGAPDQPTLAPEAGGSTSLSLPRHLLSGSGGAPGHPLIPGAPLFRRIGGLPLSSSSLAGSPAPVEDSRFDIYASAQPDVEGLETVLSILGSGAASEPSARRRCVWVSTRQEPIVYINGRPYVLREEAAPQRDTRRFAGVAASRLDGIERRLRDDCLSESSMWHHYQTRPTDGRHGAVASSSSSSSSDTSSSTSLSDSSTLDLPGRSHPGGLILVHEEIDGRIIACWIYAREILTPSEMFASVRARNFDIHLERVPVTAGRAPDTRGLDRLASIVLDPRRGGSSFPASRPPSPTSHQRPSPLVSSPMDSNDGMPPASVSDLPAVLIFSCQSGAGRSSMLMALAWILRSAYIVGEPFFSQPAMYGTQSLGMTRRQLHQLAASSPAAGPAPTSRDQLILRLLALANRQGGPPGWAQMLLATPGVIDRLLAALGGEYAVARDLIAALAFDGPPCKAVIDSALDHCSARVHLREAILDARLAAASHAATVQAQRRLARLAASSHLELSESRRYFYGGGGDGDVLGSELAAPGDRRLLGPASLGLEDDDFGEEARLGPATRDLFRYLSLIPFSAYVLHHSRGGFQQLLAFLGSSPFPAVPGSPAGPASYGLWLEQRPELLSILLKVRRRSPASQNFSPIDTLRLPGPVGAPVPAHLAGHPGATTTAMDLFVSARSGVVLACHTILKPDTWTAAKQRSATGQSLSRNASGELLSPDDVTEPDISKDSLPESGIDVLCGGVLGDPADSMTTLDLARRHRRGSLSRRASLDSDAAVPPAGQAGSDARATVTTIFDGDTLDLEEDHSESCLPGLMTNSLLGSQGRPSAGGPQRCEYRRMPGVGLPIYAVPQPSASEIRRVVEAVKQELLAQHPPTGATPLAADAHAAQLVVQADTSLLWVNLREEPVVYINGVPFVVRDADASFGVRADPSRGRSFRGISGDRLEQIELCLKVDVQKEAHNNGNRVLIHSEKNGELAPEWVDIQAVQTPREVFAAFSESSTLPITYHRIPLPHGRTPSPAEYDALLQAIQCGYQPMTPTASGAPALPPRPVVFNCQMGRARSTLACVISRLIRDSCDPTMAQRSDDLSYAIPEKQFPLILALVRAAGGLGLLAQAHVDRAIDDAASCGGFHIRSAIRDLAQRAANILSLQTEQLAELPATGGLPQASGRIKGLQQTYQRATSAAISALVRYYNLIVFEVYLLDCQLRRRKGGPRAESPVDQSPGPLDSSGLPDGTTVPTFSEWTASHPEFAALLEGIYEESNAADSVLTPLAAYNAEESALSTSSLPDPEMKEPVNQRRFGSVLSAQTILKSDHFSGCHRLPPSMPRIDGVPNFRKVVVTGRLGGSTAFHLQATDVTGTGMPTREAIGRTLEQLLLGPDGTATTPSERVSLIWTNMREEPVVYVRGQPFALRTHDRLTANVLTAGMSTERVERMEECMKLDILRELESNAENNSSERGGSLLLIHDEDPGTMQTIARWELGVRAEDIRTTSEVFDEAFRDFAAQYPNVVKVDFLRLPVTDEQAPMPHVFDMLFERVISQQLDSLELGTHRDEFIFNCQMGRGRTTTAMIIAALTRGFLLRSASVAGALLAGQDPQSARAEATPFPDASTVPLSMGPGLGLEASESDLLSSTESRLDSMVISQAERDRRFQAGEYLVVMDLVRLLYGGKTAKRLTDQAIDSFSHVQNLRTAIHRLIEGYERLKSSPGAGHKRAEIHEAEHVTVNYLHRYFLLITFNSYLLERERDTLKTLTSEEGAALLEAETDRTPTGPTLARILRRAHAHSNRNFTSFDVWYNQRPELQAVFRDKDKDNDAADLFRI